MVVTVQYSVLIRMKDFLFQVNLNGIGKRRYKVYSIEAIGFWSVVKSKLKREKLLEIETLHLRITEAC